MFRNIIIIAISLLLATYCIFMFMNRNRYEKARKILVFQCFVVWFLAFFLFNIPVLVSPMTPAIAGKVIDSDSKRPIPNCNIKAYWKIETGSVGGRNVDTYHQYVTRTDDKGNFVVPRHLKVLGVYLLPPLIISRYEGMTIVAYAHGYKHTVSDIRDVDALTIIGPPQPATVSNVMDLKKSPAATVVDDLLSLKNIFRTQNVPRGVTSHDNKFLVEELGGVLNNLKNTKKLSRTKDLRDLLLGIAGGFEVLGDNRKAIEAYQFVEENFPDSAAFVENEILRIKRSKSR